MIKKVEGDLLLEEVVDKALVPESEQPYELPDNWCWTYLGSMCKFIGGGTPSKTNSQYWNGDIPWASVKDIKSEYLYDTIDYITQDGLDNSSAKVCDINELILVTRIEPGKTIIAKKPVAINQDLKIVKTNINTKFLHYYFKTIKHLLQEKSSGSTVLGITKSNIENTPFPLPPLSEQERIVEQFEILFCKLDEAKETINEIIDLIDLQKASILHRAFNGDLTAQWRYKNGIKKSSWVICQMNDVCDVRDGTHDSPQYYDSGYPLVTSKNLKNGNITNKDLKFIREEDYLAINQRSKVNIGDVLFAMIGTIGNPVEVIEEPNYAIKNVALFKPKTGLNSSFLKYYLDSKDVLDRMQNDAKGSTQKFVSLGYLRTFKIDLPTLEEQIEIVRTVKSLLDKGERAYYLLDIIEDIELLKKSILAKAFRGELSTTDFSEPSSVELIKDLFINEL